MHQKAILKKNVNPSDCPKLTREPSSSREVHMSYVQRQETAIYIARILLMCLKKNNACSRDSFAGSLFACGSF